VNVRLARLVDEAIVWIVVSFLLFGLVGLLLGWLNMVTTSPIELAPAFSAKQRTAAIRDIEAQRELLTRQAEGSLRSFYRQQWNIVEKLTPRVDNWHLDAICDHLSATVAPPGERPAINKLVINVPPRNSKSTTSCVAFPAWVWGPRNLPGKRFIFVTYRLSLARRDSRYTRNVITSPWYQAAWGDRFSLVRDQKTKDRYDNDKTGYRMIGSFRGGVMGEGANYLVIDDPLDATSLASPTELEHVIEIWKTGLVTRLNHQEQDVRIIIMQRLHENDLCGHVLKEDGWTHLRLPAAFEVEDRCRTFVEVQGTKQLFFEDPRTEDGEPLNPKRFPAADLERMRVEDEWVFAAQQQQRPAPRGGQILQKAWWRFYDSKPFDADGKPRKPDHGAQSWDLAFKDLKTSDYVAALAGELYGADIYLTDYLLERAGFSATCDLMRQWHSRHSHLAVKLVEDKANGPAVADALKQEVPGIVLVEPEGGKIARAFAAQPTLKAGNVYLPNPVDPITGKLIPERAWVQSFIKNCEVFPKGLHDDDVDAFTQLVTYLRGTHSAMLDYLKQLKARDAKKADQEAGRA
jgi:predicted phage terminase large subunit-like protein